MARYDGVILGAGHNALILQAYLARCGLRTVSLDRADVPGGGLATVENPRRPGFLHNTHSFFHRGLTAMPWYRDLELERRGVQYVEPELNVAMLLRDGRSLCWWTDFERTADSVAQFSRKDADALRSWRDAFVPVVENILRPEAASLPLSGDRRRELLERSAAGRLLLEVAALSPVEFVRRDLENDVVRAGLLFFNGLREVDLRLEGFGHSIPALLASRPMAQMCLGGSARLAEALVADICEHGGEVRTGVTLRSILVCGGRAAGVELAGGERLEAAGFVASGLNPQQTLLQLMDADAAPARVREQASGFQYNLLAPLFALNLALSEPPRYTAAEHDPELQRAFMVILGLERFGQFDEIVAAHEAGRIPGGIEPLRKSRRFDERPPGSAGATVMWGATPTVFDPSQAPAGGHTAFLWEKLPYAVGGDASNWDRLSEQHAAHMLSQWSRYAPNLAEPGVVLDAFSRSPLDTERSLPNMRYGDLLVGSFAAGQVGENRPFAGAGHYRVPGVAGLYLCGGSTHPGGNITGLCGYNAAAVVASDLEITPWWPRIDVEESLAVL